MNSPAEIVHVQNVSMQYQTSGGKTVDALTAVDLTVRRSEFGSLIGPSGCGKSTLLHIMGGMRRATTGTVELDGREVSSPHPDEIGFVFQAFNLISSLRIEENVEVPLFYQGRHRSQRRKRACEALAMVGLDTRLGHRPSELSGGQQQRVAIARALVTDPVILLADEPTGALDSKTSEDIMEIFQTLNEQGITIIVVTHEAEIADHAKRRIEFRDGKVVEDVPVAPRGTVRA